MSPLNIHPEEIAPVSKKKKSKTLKVMLGLAALVLIPVIGTTFAATIAVNTGGAVEFGQGVTQTTACDNAVTVLPTASFANSASIDTATVFSLNTIKISDIASTCNDKTFTVKVYDNAGANPLTIATASGSAVTTAVSVVFKSAGSGMAPVATTNATVSDQSSTSFTITLATAVPATEVYKITVETS
jgi:membrane-bound inhibitor of C-type lysozyme